MRGYKWQLIALYLSFVPFYTPLLLAGALLLLLPGGAPLLGISEPTTGIIRIGLYTVAAVNLLVTAYVAPYLAACFRAFYIERKREALMDEEITQMDFVAMPKLHNKTTKQTNKATSARESAQAYKTSGMLSKAAQKDESDD